MNHISKPLIIPLYSHSGKIECIYLGKKYDHNTIVFYSADDEEPNYYYIPEEKDRHNWILKTIEIYGLEDKSYYAYTTNETNGQESKSIICNVFKDKNKDICKSLLSAASYDMNDEDIVTLLSKIGDTTDTIKVLYNINNDTTNKYTDNVKKYAAILLSMFIERINKQVSYTTEINSIDVINGKIEYDDTIKKIIDVDFSEDTPYVKIHNINTADDKNCIVINRDINRLHLYIFYDEDEECVDIKISFMPNESIFKEIWENNKLSIDKYNSIIEKTLSYDNSYSDFSGFELKIASMINEYTPVQPIVKCPTFEYHNGIIKYSIGYGYNILKALNKQFYIEFIEAEIMLKTRDCIFRTPITKQEDTFYAKKLGLSDEPYIVYISDENRNIVSTVRFLDLSDIYKYQYSADYDDSSDLDIDISEFHEKIRQQELSKYSQHMHNYISIHNSDSRTVIDDVLSLLKIDNDTDKVDVADELIDGLCVEQNRTTFFDMCRSLYEDNTIYGNYLIQYFNSSIKYFYKENKVMFPPVEDTLFVYDSYYINGYKKRDFQESSPILNTYYRYDNDVHFGVAWAINKTTYKRSGFIIIDFTGGLLNPKMGTYLIKADRVIY